jgi:hypothetical protein
MRESARFLGLADQVLDRFRPHVLLTYGGHPACLELMRRARLKSVAVVFHLHNPAKPTGDLVAARRIISYLRRVGLGYDRRRRLVTCRGRKAIELPYCYLGADDQAGANYTGQPAVDSYYEVVEEAGR